VARVKPGDEIFVTERQGRESSGHFTRLSSASMALLVNGVEREISRGDIGRIERPDSLWNGALIGGALGALLGTGAGASCSPHCAAAVTGTMLGFGAAGAVLGARIDGAAHHRSTVYGSPPSSPNALRPRPPVSSIGDLWRRARGGDSVRVLDVNGQVTTGRILEMSASSVALLTEHRRQEMEAGEIREIIRRGDRRWLGTLVGLAVGAAAATVKTPKDECRRHPSCAVDAAVMGYVIGAFVPRYAAIYRP
jgi:uncharacterized protein YcfJ